MNTTPYTYLIGWSNLNIYYYGRRTAVNCHPDDLWRTYFTSSPTVWDFVATHGQPDIVKIRKVFSKTTDCAEWENRFLRKINAAKNPMFLNKSNGDAKFDVSGMTTVVDTLTGETTQVSIDEFNSSNRYKGVGFGLVVVIVLSTGESTKVSTEEYHTNKHLYRHHAEGTITVTDLATDTQIKISTAEFHRNRHLYRHHSDGATVSIETRDKIRAGNTNKAKSESHKKNISEALKGKKKTAEHIANSKKNRTPPFKAVVVNGLNFLSVNAAAAHFGVRHPTISNLLAGRKKLSEKFWEVRYATTDQTPTIS